MMTTELIALTDLQCPARTRREKPTAQSATCDQGGTRVSRSYRIRISRDDTSTAGRCAAQERT